MLWLLYICIILQTALLLQPQMYFANCYSQRHNRNNTTSIEHVWIICFLQVYYWVALHCIAMTFILLHALQPHCSTVHTAISHLVSVLHPVYCFFLYLLYLYWKLFKIWNFRLSQMFSSITSLEPTLLSYSLHWNGVGSNRSLCLEKGIWSKEEL